MSHRIDLTRANQAGTADSWPSWTDLEVWELGPDPEDAEWWASQNTEADDDGPSPDDPIWQEWAEEAEAADRIERGLGL